MDGEMTFSTRTVYKDEMISCARCNIPYASAKMLKKVLGMLQGKQGMIRPCPSCRQKEIFENIFSRPESKPSSKNDV
jgi:hypothetical protein